MNSLRRTISLYKYDKLLKAIFDRIKADDRYTARLVKSYESLSKNLMTKPNGKTH